MDPMTRTAMAGLRPLDVALGAGVLTVGIARIVSAPPLHTAMPFVIALGMAAAVTLYRRAPAIALGLVWATATLQLIDGLDVALVQAAALIVAYGTSRYGSTPTVIAGVASIPLGGIAAVLFAQTAGLGQVVQESGLRELLGLLISSAGVGIYDVPTGLVIGFVLVAALLGAPWALGLVLRFRERSREADRERIVAEEETAQARELANLRAEQARLARDVHDVVGHSLAVIVAQADSTRALPDDEIASIRAAVANIAETARRSLRDVRTVLSDTPSPAKRRATDDLSSLIDGVRSGGTDVAAEELGTPRPLPPDLEVVAYRTLQELLTNALKHGVTADGIGVSLDWRTDALVMIVRNVVARTPVTGDLVAGESVAADSLAGNPVAGSPVAGNPVAADSLMPDVTKPHTAANEHGPGGGTGLDGVRDRLAAVGGSLETSLDGENWVATATVPVRTEGATA